MQFDRNRLKEVVLHIAGQVPAHELGAVKLHKVLYFSDMLSYALSGRAITGATYRKRPFGPTCAQLLPVLGELEREGRLAVEQEEFHGFRKLRYRALAEPDLAVFPDEDVALIDDVIDFVCRKNSARSISEFSHQTPWEMAEFGEIIGYETALLLLNTQPSPQILDRIEAGEREIAAQGQGSDALDRRPYAAFRARFRAADTSLSV